MKVNILALEPGCPVDRSDQGEGGGGHYRMGGWGQGCNCCGHQAEITDWALNTSTERQAAQHYGRSQWQRGRCGIIGGSEGK